MGASSTAILYDTSDMEDLLGSKLAEFLDTDYKYSLNQIASGTRPHLYRGPNTQAAESHKESQEGDINIIMN